jgi:hypothetical protein
MTLKICQNLRHLHIDSLDRATSGASALANKPFLKDLYLSERAPLIEERHEDEQRGKRERRAGNK